MNPKVQALLTENHTIGKSNHRNLGVINSGNLCTEIVQFSSPNDTAVCTLASLRLDVFVDDDENFNFAELHRVTKIVVRNTDRIIDINSYPTTEAQASAQNTRALGIGVQGLADVFMMLRLPFESMNARLLNRAIFETIYHAAIDASCDLARQKGPYPCWSGSPASDLQLQFDLWNSRPSGRYDFDSLKARIRKYGLRNSLLTAQMPTSATSHITGVNDGTDPFLRYMPTLLYDVCLTFGFSSNLYVRRTLDGEFEMACKWLVRELIYLDLWTEDVRNQLIRDHGAYRRAFTLRSKPNSRLGSIQNIDGIPDNLKAVYKTAWEIPQRAILDLAADRGPFICQSQSTSIHFSAPDHRKMVRVIVLLLEQPRFLTPLHRHQCISMAGKWVSRRACITCVRNPLHIRFNSDFYPSPTQRRALP